MLKLKWRWAAMAFAGLLAGCGPSLRTMLPDAWKAWERGEIAEARALAVAQLSVPRKADSARHMLFLCDFVQGRYQKALQWHSEIAPSYPLLTQLDALVVEAHIHRSDVDAALATARQSHVLPGYIEKILKRQKAHPFAISLEGVANIPFAEHDLRDYFPAFESEINGTPMLAHMDTGGMFLVMGPERATALGIETIDAGTTTAHLNSQSVRYSIGIADSFRLGNVSMENVPVTVLSSLNGEADFVIFGTNLLEQFFSTLDYPRERLLLSLRGDTAANDEHRALLPAETARMPFLLWEDHFMIARGEVGSRGDLNFFIDSGLVYVLADAEGNPAQAAFATSRQNFLRFGVPLRDVREGFFPMPESICLGSLEQTGLYGVVGTAVQQNLGGIRIDGLLSHAFLKSYSWTIDFDEMEYVFGE